jgi:sugar O-acyltransferase (sialic acid O-acetyltransferase NeuD family)
VTIELIILGAGGTSAEVFDFLDDINADRHTYTCLGFLDDDERKWGTHLCGAAVLGPLASAYRWPNARFVNALGSPANFWRREEIVSRTGIAPERFETIVHPSARVSRRSSLASGTIVFPQVVIGAGAAVGRQAIILSQAVLNHDVRIGDYTIVASGVGVAGRVSVGRGCYLGAGSQIIQDAAIGDYCLVGMGSVVLETVPRESVVVGVPARHLRRTFEPTSARCPNS